MYSIALLLIQFENALMKLAHISKQTYLIKEKRNKERASERGDQGAIFNSRMISSIGGCKLGYLLLPQ